MYTFAPNDLNYANCSRCFYLKKKLAEKHNVSVENITLGNGSNDILEMAAHAFVTNKHEVIYSKHSFAVYPLVTQAVGAKHVITQATEWGHDLDAMLSSVNDNNAISRSTSYSDPLIPSPFAIKPSPFASQSS